MESLQLMTSQPLSGLIIEPTKSAEEPEFDVFPVPAGEGIPF